jgi:aminoacylase
LKSYSLLNSFLLFFTYKQTGLASPDEHYRAFYGERSPWWLVIKAVGDPGHGSKLYDNSAMENLLKSIESIQRYRTSQFDLIKAGLKADGDVVSINMAFLKAGTPSPTVSQPTSIFHQSGQTCLV